MDLHLNIEKNSSSPLYRQVYEQIRDQILSGALHAGCQLPPTRKLADQLDLARITVSSAYKQLQAEGYLISRVGAGTFVASDLPGLPRLASLPHQPYSPDFSSWGQRIMQVRRVSNQDGGSRLLIDFGFGRSFPHIFPYDIWRRMLARYLSTDDVMLSRYGSAAGFEPLRQAVAEYLARLRGVNCSSEQVVIVSGMQQALDLLSRLLLRQGDEVLVEDPGYTDAIELFRTYGARLTALTVDEDGFPVEEILPGGQVRFAFVTPSNQFPKGGTMPLPRRLAILQWAHQSNALILEDDYDGELRYSEHPVAALQGLDEEGQVVYLGTFSKVLFPALRLGYVVLPWSLLAPFIRAKELVDRGAPTLTQAAVADFITEGHFERHLRRLRKEYGDRRRLLVHEIEKNIPNQLRYSKVEAGLHVMLYLPDRLDETRMIRMAAEAGVGVYPGRPYHFTESPPPSILLGFSGLSNRQIVKGVRILADVMRKILRV